MVAGFSCQDVIASTGGEDGSRKLPRLMDSREGSQERGLQGPQGSLGILKQGVIRTLGIPRDSKRRMVEALGIPREYEKGKTGPPGTPRDSQKGNNRGLKKGSGTGPRDP